MLPGGDPLTCAALAAEAEGAGWDGVFVPDCISIETDAVPPSPAYDPWVTLAAMAMRTRSIRLGTLITPLPRRRPWKLAQESVTLDHLSGGRLTLAVGLGAAADDAGFYKVGEALDLRTRAELLDEGLQVLTGLWSGQPLTFQGVHYQVQGMTLLPRPVQSPHIPLWVVGVWPRPRSLARALQWDGLVLQMAAGNAGRPTPSDVTAARAYVAAHRPGDTPYDVVVEGETPAGDVGEAVATVRAYAEAGATWWIESRWTSPEPLTAARDRIRIGPPRS